MSMQAALRAELLAETDITDLTSTRIYDGWAPEDAGFPRILMVQISGDSFNHLTGESPRARVSYQIGCWSTSTASAQAVADVVRLRISGKRGTFGTGGNTATVESCKRSASFTAIEDPHDGRGIPSAYGQIETYDIIYTQTPA